MTGKRAGYYGFGINQGRFVSDDDALDFALEQCGLAVAEPDAPACEEALAAVEEWYFSDAWLHVKEERSDA